MGHLSQEGEERYGEQSGKIRYYGRIDRPTRNSWHKMMQALKKVFREKRERKVMMAIEKKKGGRVRGRNERVLRSCIGEKILT